MNALALIARIETLASDVGRLRRHLREDDYAAHLVNRIGLHVDAVDAWLQPSAGELVCAGADVDQALARLDSRARHLRSLLGEAAQ